ncbi:hypothetical protein R1sor_027201 [Riccia sorocarpa]|uniref:Reverse transcriptase domain-containing protein n=1 Tax=Riccia sorocarpa TaxID=122646 RepID=A0ABD3GDK7_9MARC
MGVWLRREHREVYEEKLTGRLGNSEPSPAALSLLVQNLAKETFPPRSSRRSKSWDRAVSSQPEDRLSAFREYRHFIRAKKRLHLRQQQIELANDLMLDPQSFWRRLQSRKPVSALEDGALYQYVETLLHFPDAVEMPTASGDECCVFTEEEISKTLARMRHGKVRDLAGLSIELLQWRGPPLWKQVTRLINLACQNGLPSAWTERKLVPLHKTGPREIPGNYRMIMVASIYAKLLGNLLDTRLREWCESKNVQAPVQAGFRKSYSVLDHLLVLRVLGERAKCLRRPLLVLFIDFPKAFDSISRKLLWDRMIELNVPPDLVKAITTTVPESPRQAARSRRGGH